MPQMADYIDKNILCQAYIHVELPESTTAEQLEAIKQHLLDFTTARAKFFVYPEVEIEAEFKHGSLKSYLTIAGSIYLAVVSYGSFRKGVDYLYTDIKRLGDCLVSESLFTTRSRPDAIKRTESRTGITGSLKLLVDDLTLLESSMGQISTEEAARKIDRLRLDSEQLLANVNDENDRNSIEAEIDLFADSLPDNYPHPKEKVPNDAAIFLYQDALTGMRKRFGKKSKIPIAPPAVIRNIDPNI